MVFQIAAAVILPIVMLIVVAPPFEEIPTKIETNQTQEDLEKIYIIFFVIWTIWIMILLRIVYQVKKGRFYIQRSF